VEGKAMDIAGQSSQDDLDKVKVALSLYKVQPNIYLLDFQRIEVMKGKQNCNAHKNIFLTLPCRETPLDS
jgi:hypothetical protein